jgi:ferredoxin-NADP reductase
MAGTALRRRLNWTLGRVVRLSTQSPTARSLFLEVPGWAGHRAGQHVDVRLTAPDGYQARRSYSIASAPGDPLLELTVERLPDGEVSPYLTEVLQPGDELELRGPIGGWFVWEPRLGGPLLLVAGGSGAVPLVAMARHRAALGAGVPATLLYSSRTWEDVLFKDELARLAEGPDGLRVVHTLTRQAPEGWRGRTGRVDAAILAEVAPPAAAAGAEDGRIAYVCGPTPFVEAVASALAEAAWPAQRVKTERFGPTG